MKRLKRSRTRYLSKKEKSSNKKRDENTQN